MKISSVAACMLVLLSACGEDAEPSDPSVSSQTETQNVVEVDLTEYSFEMPEEVTGGTVTFEMANTGAQPHEAALVGIEGDRDIADVEKALAKGEEPDWTSDLAGIPVISSGMDVAMTRELEEGRYMFMCFLPTPEGQPHASQGMIKIFDVAGTSEATSPEPDFTISVDEDGFDVPALTAGTHTIELKNEGEKNHELAFISFEPGKQEKDLGRWFGSGYEGEPPALFPGGIQGIDPGVSVILEMTFESGRTYTLEDFPNDLREEIVIE